MQEINQTPSSAWRRIELKGASRQYNHPRILDRRTTLTDYAGPVRQVIVTDLGHEEPTILLTNQLTRTAAHLVGRYAQRMIIENSIADGIDFFHMDALSSAVAMKVNCDLQLTLANRQRIANMFPPAHRSVFVISDRRSIASIGGGGDSCWRR